MNLSTKIIFHCLLLHHTLAVIVIPLSLTVPQLYKNTTRPVLSGYELVSRIVPSLNDRIVSPDANLSWRGKNKSYTIYPARDSLIRGSIEAGIQHQHLAIRPDDVWLTILSQMNFYLKRHRMEKVVLDKFDNIQGNSHFMFVSLVFMVPDYPFALEMRQRNKTGWLIDWIQPGFSTTTGDDKFTADFQLMATSTPASEPGLSPTCGFGIPSITLLGTPKDWETLLRKLDRFREFGEELARYGTNLRPILSRMLATFKDPNSYNIRQFWSNMIIPERVQCNKSTVLSGWINGFHLWDQNGTLLSTISGSREGLPSVVLDDVAYPWQDSTQLPTASYSFRLCAEFELFAFGGMLATSIIEGIPEGYVEAMRSVNFTLPSSMVDGHHSTLQPYNAHAIAVKGEKVSLAFDRRCLVVPFS
jgi:hypothetical protein